MDYVSNKDFYEIRFASLITNVDKDALLELYQPLIGATATSLYLTMLKQKKNAEGGNIFKTEQLLKTMMLDSEQFFTARKYLEACGLIRTYESIMDDVRCYIFVVYSPKSPKAFFEDVLFKGLLIQKVGETEVNRLANKYKVNLVIPDDYKEVSASFVDVYKLDYDDPSFVKEIRTQLIGRNHGKENLEFNNDLFIGYIKENSSMNISSFKKTDMKEIARLATLFGLNEQEIAFAVIDTKLDTLDIEKVKIQCEKSIECRKIDNTEKSVVSGDSVLADKIKMMEEVAPTKFLQYLQQGTKPARSDINIVYSLSKNYGFSNGVINVIVEYVLHKNKNILSQNYCEKIASSLARENILTAVDAMNYLNKMTLKTVKTKSEKTEKTNEKVESSEDLTLDDMNSLIDELEVMKNVK